MANQFLIKETVDAMRNLSTIEIAGLQGTNATYLGVELLGYYEKGDTPAPIRYYLSNTAESDDGGSVFEVNGIKLEHEFKDIVDVRYFGLFDYLLDVTSLATNITRNLARKGLGVAFLQGDYRIDATQNSNSGFVIQENTKVITGQNTRFVCIPNSNGTYNIITLRGVSKFYSNNLNIVGERGQHTGTTGEWGMGFTMRGCSNVIINNLAIIDCWGDGLYLGTDGGKENHNIEIGNINIDNCRRNGVSFVNVRDMFIENMTVTNTNGTNPQRALDFEPNFDTEYIQNINIKNLRTFNNVNGGVNVQTLSMSSSSPYVSVNIENYRSENEPALVGFGMRQTRVRGQVNIGNLTSSNAPEYAILYRYFFNQPDVYIKNAFIENSNTLGDAQFYNSSVAIYVDTNDEGDIEPKYQTSINIDNLVVTKSNQNTAYSVFVQNRINNSIPINNVNIKSHSLDRPVNFTSYGKLQIDKVKRISTGENNVPVNKYDIYTEFNNSNSESDNSIDLQKGYLGQVVKIVNASGRALKIGSTIAASTIDGIFDVSTPVAYKYLKSEFAGDFLVLENIGFGNNFAQWKIIQQYGQWSNADLKLEAKTLVGREVYGSNSTGSADISAIELDGLDRSCFFRAAGVNALGINIQHTVNNGYAFQIRQKDYTSSNIMVRIKNNNVWTDWVEYLPMKQALASLNSAANPSATYQQSEAQSVLNELRDLKAKLRAAGIMAN